MHRIDVAERRARLVERHLLSPEKRAGTALAVARSVVALHSTDAVTVFLSIHARAEVQPADIERELYEERTLVRILGMRRTLFVVPRELVPVVYAACTRTIAARERRRLEKFIEDSGISSRPADWLRRALATARKALEVRGEAFTRDLVAEVPILAKRLHVASGTRFEATQSVGSRVLPQLAMEGRIVRGRPRGSWVSGQYRWVPVEIWLEGSIPAMEQATAQAELLGRWLAAFGPATETDIRWWTGWTAREARAALAAVPNTVVDLDGAAGFVLADDLEPADRHEPSAALLPTLDPTTMGWKEREWYLGEHASLLFDSNGNAGPTVWWDGRVVGGWSQRRDGEIVYRLLEDVGSDAVRAVAAESARVSGWLGDARFSPGFLPPFQRELATS
ncbi:MAG: winged helix DNA-binding domain-containing protein [Actinomycetota bacterium]|nr:winged helix DNA-binding domain-containing protein [Actinomycetota bacterium]